MFNVTWIWPEYDLDVQHETRNLDVHDDISQNTNGEWPMRGWSQTNRKKIRRKRNKMKQNETNRNKIKQIETKIETEWNKFDGQTHAVYEVHHATIEVRPMSAESLVNNESRKPPKLYITIIIMMIMPSPDTGHYHGLERRLCYKVDVWRPSFWTT
jgi:hypothetical protein